MLARVHSSQERVDWRTGDDVKRTNNILARGCRAPWASDAGGFRTLQVRQLQERSFLATLAHGKIRRSVLLVGFGRRHRLAPC